MDPVRKSAAVLGASGLFVVALLGGCGGSDGGGSDEPDNGGNGGGGSVEEEYFLGSCMVNGNEPLVCFEGSERVSAFFSDEEWRGFCEADDFGTYQVGHCDDEDVAAKCTTGSEDGGFTTYFYYEGSDISAAEELCVEADGELELF